MNESRTVSHHRKRIVPRHNRETCASLSQAKEVWPLLATVFRMYITAPGEVRNLLHAVTCEVRNFPRTPEPSTMAERKADDGSFSDIESALELKFDATTENPWHLVGFQSITHKEAVRQHPTDVKANFKRLSSIHHFDKHNVHMDKETKD